MTRRASSLGAGQSPGGDRSEHPRRPDTDALLAAPPSRSGLIPLFRYQGGDPPVDQVCAELGHWRCLEALVEAGPGWCQRGCQVDASTAYLWGSHGATRGGDLRGEA